MNRKHFFSWTLGTAALAAMTLGATNAAAQPRGPMGGGPMGPGPMHELDTNGDGQITLEEAQAQLTDLTQEQFDARDTNGDGVWSREDMRGRGPDRHGRGMGGPGGDGMQPPGPGMHGPRMNMREADTNDDGQITAEEFAAANPDAPADLFTHLDQNEDGVLTPDDRPEGRRGPGMDIGRCDTDEDGQVTEDEFAAANPDAPADLFTHLDQNGDGVLTPDDRPEGRRGPHMGPPPGMREADTNDDGQISAEEFAAANPDAPADLFTHLDRNGDGVLTPEDRPAGRPGPPMGPPPGMNR